VDWSGRLKGASEAGVDDNLSDTYRDDADELAERLQRYRQEHAGAKQHRPDRRDLHTPTA